MASVSGGQGANKIDVELNLVPFIDLLSTLVLFLLITAVWLQVSALTASVDSKGKSTNTVPDQNKIVVHVTRGGYQLTWPAMYSKTPGLPGSLPKQKDRYNTANLIGIFKKLARVAPLPVVSVSGGDDATYGSVVEAIDAAKIGGGTAVSLSTN
ncbi:MAG: hypothetical protein A2583_05455 [Bdellovibrionales bacterium RIFOXYD1_FULL_53_11]|nr:MAG: hypothetical protein A2583_05455 [Bdellovibrionales bacterium RIFOXYD1_FULL_53_11]